MQMRKLVLFSAVSAAILAGCASTGGQSSMSSEQLSDCLQPNRRVTIELSGLVPVKPKPGQKKAKPKSVQVTGYVQGNGAFDPGSATLKEGGKKDLDKFIAGLSKKHIQPSAVILSGHIDRLEAQEGMKSLDEKRAEAVRDYLESHGVSKQVIFWEGKDDKAPMAVTKFCA
jgi:outer membrane protein OmpA-like peptidoglycan-associated protein